MINNHNMGMTRRMVMNRVDHRDCSMGEAKEREKEKPPHAVDQERAG